MKQEIIQKAEKQPKTRKPNLTGIPTQTKLNFEQRSGLSFDDVRVHYNSSSPARIGALAYTQGTQVYIGPGQEKHLRHELGHVIQQKTMPVRNTYMLMGNIPICQDDSLERDADAWLTKIQDMSACTTPSSPSIAPIQRYIRVGNTSYVQSAKKDGSEIRALMVKEGEAATLYINETIKEESSTSSDLFNTLSALGIQRDTSSVPDPAGNATSPCYYRYIQTRIPSTGDDKAGVRNDEQRERALSRLSFQKIMTDLMVENCKHICRHYEASQITVQIAEGMIELIESEINYFLPYVAGNKKNTVRKKEVAELFTEASISFLALGSDITDILFALYHSAVNLYNIATNSVNQIDRQDELSLLYALEADLSYRRSQIEKELETLSFRPVLPTDCGFSADARYELTNAYNAQNPPKKVGFDKKESTGAPLPWNYHLGTSLPVSEITTDGLYIEDAVGKSSCGWERANSHWSAHIYGKEEDQNSIAVQGNEHSQEALRGPKYIFNSFSEQTRIRLWGIIGDNSKWSASIKFGSDDEPCPTLTITKSGTNFTSQMTNFPNEPTHETDFLVKTVQQAIDGLVVSAFSAMGADSFQSFRNSGSHTHPTANSVTVLKKYTDFMQSVHPLGRNIGPGNFNTGMKFSIEDLVIIHNKDKVQ